MASENVDLSNIDGLLRTILVQLRPVVLNAVNNAMAQSTVAGNINADSLTDRIIREITTFVRLALEEEVLKATSNLENEVVEQVGYQSNVQIDFTEKIVKSFLRIFFKKILKIDYTIFSVKPICTFD